VDEGPNESRCILAGEGAGQDESRE
jgi:hypothetical protein